jgi:PAS domain S-box-containing protein
MTVRHAFGRLPIARKLTLLILGTSVGVLLLGAVAFGTYQVVSSRTTSILAISTLAELVAENGVAAILFNDHDEASRVLKTLEAEPSILSAVLYGPDKNVIADYGTAVVNRDEPPMTGRSGEYTTDGRVIVDRPIILQGDTVGFIRVTADLGMGEQVRDYLTITVLVLTVCVLIALVLSLKLQHLVSDPIRTLAHAASAVSREGDLTVRVPETSSDELGALATVFNGMLGQIDEQMNELRRLATAVEQSPVMIVITGQEGLIQYVNPAFEEHTGYTKQEVVGRNPNVLQSGKHDTSFYEDLWNTIKRGESWSGHFVNRRKDGTLMEEEATISPVRGASGQIGSFVAVKRDVTEQKALEAQLAQAQKLESIGQLAAGIAHEINTPTQYVGDNTRFFKDSFGDLSRLLAQLIEVTRAARSGPIPTELLDDLDQAIDRADLDFLLEEIPRAIDQSLEGVGRVSRIVRAMKEFSHPSTEKTLIDLNAAIQSTIDVASNEWKYVASVVTEFDEKLPSVACVPGEFNQVILNMVVNAAHAIADVVGDGAERKGTITIRTGHGSEWAEIVIADSGAGMSEDVKRRIFDPFFTTKQVGRGTGQGLSIAHAVVVQKHGGSISVESQPGRGTAFTIRLPLIPDAEDVAGTDNGPLETAGSRRLGSMTPGARH